MLVVIELCIGVCCVPNAFGARRHDAPGVVDRAPGVRKSHAASKPPAPRRRLHRKTWAARNVNIYYRWSAEQLMLGGVDPGQIGKLGADNRQEQSKKGAASSR
ncbi:hypothetical protein [Burkholderia sp. Ac-20365]|uniref:hypothetical protein n=1 Tax=Burkholderia sp. Ac-20365 TaxID=2703897 RepID=UPI00197C5606|nr:hypothetical protein [Burkholderia sp. Ac-20365]MBN3762379.1 hypothetical protein [Burkholderia sp. Ac-20365]